MKFWRVGIMWIDGLTKLYHIGIVVREEVNVGTKRLKKIIFFI